MIDHGIFTCSKHNYTGTSAVCPHCYNEQQNNEYKRLYDIEKRRREAAEAFIAARIEMCKKNHLCDAIELQRDFETFTAWKQSITNYNNAIQEAAHE